MLYWKLLKQFTKIFVYSFHHAYKMLVLVKGGWYSGEENTDKNTEYENETVFANL